MNIYSRNFKKYLDDLCKRKPSPGGGSTVCLIFCTGVSLIEKAINYSLCIKINSHAQKRKNDKLKKKLSCMRKMRRKIYPYIDKDGYIFEHILLAKGSRRKLLIKASEELIVDVGRSCGEVFSLAKAIESDIKGGIISDFNIGLNFVRVALSGCISNLEANNKMFNSRSTHINSFKRILKKWH